jgi:hypothetical protein
MNILDFKKSFIEATENSSVRSVVSYLLRF